MNFTVESGVVYLAAFLIVNIIIFIIFPKHYRKKLFAVPSFNNKFELIFSGAYALLFNGTLLYSIFIPLSADMPLKIIGTMTYLISLSLFVIALHNYAYAPKNLPVTTGIYKYSRNPQQILASVMWLGVGISLGSIVVCLSVIIQLIILYPSIIAQEKFCIKHYGKTYSEYMKHTSRYFGRYKK